MAVIPSSQSSGWSKVWRLNLPHKVKIFLWRFCRNNLPVRIRLKGKGVACPIMCSLCNVDVEHLMHVFLDCDYARSCWQFIGLQYRWDQIYSANEWLLHKLDSASEDELSRICITLYGIWLARNKKVWENIDWPVSIMMNWVFKTVQDWREARELKVKAGLPQTSGGDMGERKWTAPALGSFKVNVDASWFPEAETFSIGMVLRDHAGVFKEGRTVVMHKATNAFEAECIGMREALSWVKSREEKVVMVESDSKLTVDAIIGDHEYVLEVGHIIDQCIDLLHSLPDVSVKYVRKQANRVAHGLAKMPCSSFCCNVFTSPPTHLVEVVLFDASF